jgi:hypothetical protein
MAKEIAIRILNAVHTKQGRRLWEIQKMLPPEYQGSDFKQEHPLIEYIRELMKWNLIQVLDQKNHKIAMNRLSTMLSPRSKFYLSPQAVDIEYALDISFGGKFHSVFGAPVYNKNFPFIFVMMPFSRKFRPVYDEHIKKVAETFKLECKRADEFHAPRSIVSDIWSAINQARLIIGDCTGKNPNVFYEIGIAHALGKETILIAQSERDIPFDISPIRVIIYSLTTKEVGDEFDQQLENAMNEVLEKIKTGDELSPVRA